jgi:hypothetical protein
MGRPALSGRPFYLMVVGKDVGAEAGVALALAMAGSFQGFPLPQTEFYAMTAMMSMALSASRKSHVKQPTKAERGAPAALLGPRVRPEPRRSPGLRWLGRAVKKQRGPFWTRLPIDDPISGADCRESGVLGCRREGSDGGEQLAARRLSRWLHSRGARRSPQQRGRDPTLSSWRCRGLRRCPRS